MNIFFSVLSALYIAAIFLFAESPVVSDVRPFNPYSVLHIPVYGLLTLFLILSFPPRGKRCVRTADPTDPTHSIGTTNFLVAGSIALVVAIADEIHQAHLPNRNASMIDVFLDIVGIVLCIALVSKVACKSKLMNIAMLISGKTWKKIH